jgi:hypothetical protein
MPEVHICGRNVPEGARHICAFTNSRDEEYAILAPFAKEGLQQGERVIQIVDSAKRGDHAERMRKAGVDVAAAEGRSQLSGFGWEDAYLQEGYFDQHRMLALLESALADRKARGFPQMRAMADMEWALKGAPGTEQLLEYETRVNLLTTGMPEAFVCTYDVEKFPASTLIDVMRTHPAVVIGGIYHENPFYVPPQEMLRELQARGKAKGV